MRIVCPFCQAAYDVPVPVIDARRTLRCARCSTDFTPEATSDAAPEPLATKLPEPPQTPKPFVSLVPESVIEEAAEPMAQSDELARLARFTPDNAYQPPATLAVAAGWVVSVALIVAMGWAALDWRGAIMRVWPPSTRLYAALGYLD